MVVLSAGSSSETMVNCTRHRSPATDTHSGHHRGESDRAMVQLLQLLFAAEVRSSHPLSKGLVDFSRKRLEECDSVGGKSQNFVLL